ncbi:CRTAC1 family protein [Halogeometricum borinquense]|uniref:CRTAC1 family protein n=1 Tax=Halogeometricum borinquense TaxID=60847 RepID=A0A6C0UMD1_9EURY|nr:CRTAC1 family protein [Halogeometricum borinquense]QIB74088.1 CRTAC1 family protein [Halogeometricum borinquense]QIQ76705.1 CRTAC1 family protein [Halogeometricum borinquense]
MFENRSEHLPDRQPFKGYGAAVVAGPDRNLIFVSGYGTENRVFAPNDGSGVSDVTPDALADRTGHALGVVAADIDADGVEEVYVHNTDTYGGIASERDRLFDPTPNGWRDIFALPVNDGRDNVRAGRSVAAVDRLGTGRYGLLLACYGAPMRFYELGDNGEVTDMAAEIGIDFLTGARSLVPGPIVTERTDVFVGNERGPNYLLRNERGHFSDVAPDFGLEAPGEHARGVALVDPDGDGQFDLVIGNWEGPNHILERRGSEFVDVAPDEWLVPSRTRTVLAADFDNDGSCEVFSNVMGAPNRLLRRREGAWVACDPGAATEPRGLGTGATVCDMDGDGTLELLVVHGELDSQPLSLYAVRNENAWLRIRPLTEHGAPARNAVVTLRTDRDTQTRLICGGSGYLCQTEPVAHFGLGGDTAPFSTPRTVTVRWPDGRARTVEAPEPESELTITHPANRN